MPDLLNYMINIIRASQDFLGSDWLRYDETFRRQVNVLHWESPPLGRRDYCLSKPMKPSPTHRHLSMQSMFSPQRKQGFLMSHGHDVADLMKVVAP